jgi:putative transposase
MVDYMLNEHGMSLRQSCASINLSRTSYYYQSATDKDGSVIKALIELPSAILVMVSESSILSLKQAGFLWNHKRFTGCIVSCN